jgi:dihydrolipoamide dehydrogenase
MVVGEIAEQVDLLVVGGGPGGYVAALRAAELGREVVVVERHGAEGLGGCCLHVGCVPSKALIELAHAVDGLGRMRDAGLEADGARANLATWQVHKQRLVAELAAGVASLFKRAGVRTIRGELRFNKPDRAAVLLPDGNAQFLEFKQAILATGSRPSVLPGLAPDGERILDSTGALALDAVPRSVAVVGAGYIGLELGMALRKLGASVTVVEATDRILPTVDAALTRPVRKALDAHGIELRLGALALGVDGPDLVIREGDAEARVPAERTIVAVGRRPNTDELGLAQLGVAVDEAGLIPVDERRLANERIAAIGDVVAGPALAHKASAEGRVAAEALCGLPVAFEPEAIPAIVFTDPEVASVGLTEAQAREAGLDVAVAQAPLSVLARAATMGARDGFTKLVVDRAADRVVGVHIVGPHASELIAEGALAVEMMASPDDLAGTIHPHPTLSEGLHEAALHLPAVAPA